MPYKGKKKISDDQRRAVAKGRVDGKPDRVIAAELGLARETVTRTANDPRTLTQIAALKAKSEKHFAGIWQNMISGIERDIKSKDFNERATTRAQFLRVLTAGDPVQRIVDPSTATGDFTLEELLIAYRGARAAE